MKFKVGDTVFHINQRGLLGTIIRIKPKVAIVRWWFDNEFNTFDHTLETLLHYQDPNSIMKSIL